MVKMSYHTEYTDYTDLHEVDEDMRTISIHGGSWNYENMAGTMFRYMNVTSTHIADIVASRCCTIQKKINITHPH